MPSLVDQANIDKEHKAFAGEPIYELRRYYTDIETTSDMVKCCDSCGQEIPAYNGIWLRDLKVWFCSRCKSIYRKKLRNSRLRIVERLLIKRDKWIATTPNIDTISEGLREHE